ncbi:STAS domain-containing protein [Desulfonema magnum]|uniref:STAS domain-containing protein n=1 Tax=Desulfonema magnum TaxID=45655 RepID=A0A975BNB5_9BACT|nr:STAS domain-containing protein [Desulfonema magnum]QTA88353.1 STAS domain-containing protein [Desulfonema magnum]
MNFELKPSGDMGILTIGGELTIEHAAELRKMLIRSLETLDNVRIRIENVTAVDLSCLQLLCSAHRTALNLNKKLTLSSEASQVFNQTVEDAGYFRLSGCTPDSYKTCLWIGGNRE